MGVTGQRVSLWGRYPDAPAELGSIVKEPTIIS